MRVCVSACECARVVYVWVCGVCVVCGGCGCVRVGICT